MPIDDALDKMEGNGTDKKNGIVTPNVHFPKNKITYLHYQFSRIRTFFPDSKNNIIDTEEFLECYSEFEPCFKLYELLRDGMTLFSFEYGKWSDCFKDIINPEILEKNQGYDAKAPESMRKWIVRQAEQLFTGINNCESPEPDCHDRYNFWANKSANINDIYTDICNASSLVDLYMLGKAMHSNLEQVDAMLRIEWSKNGVLRFVKGSDYIDDLQRIAGHAEYSKQQGKDVFGYDKRDGRLSRLR